MKGIVYDTDEDAKLFDWGNSRPDKADETIRLTETGDYYLHTHFVQFHDGQEWITCPDDDQLRDLYGVVDLQATTTAGLLRYVDTVRPMTPTETLAWFAENVIPEPLRDLARSKMTSLP